MYLKCKEVLTKELSLKYNFVPVKEEKDIITCLINNINKETIEFLEVISNKKIIFKEQSLEEINKKRIEIYDNYLKDNLDKEVFYLNNNIDLSNSVVKLIDSIIEYSIEYNISDIHIEGIEDFVLIRIRLDGVLKELCKINKFYHQNIVSRIKVLSNLDYTIKNIPQDSRFTFENNNKKIDIRVATTPTVNGEKIVLRILDKSSVEYTKKGIGLSGDNLEKINLLLKQPQGLILSVGPTGSGKSSTIYTLMQSISNVKKNVMTIEDPVEYKINGINQINIDEKYGLDFQKGLEAILRLDPDILMIGEIRNFNTANTTIRASITGRVVFSTLHTSDCPSTIFRLSDMGIENYLISAGIIGIVSQRLVRKLCTCKRKVKKYVDIFDETLEYYEPAGCEKCNDGYIGRRAIFEILILNQNIKEAINKKVSLDNLTKIAVENGMVPLKESMKIALVDGITSLDEIYKNIMTINV